MKPILRSNYFVGQFLYPRGRWLIACRQSARHSVVPRNNWIDLNVLIARERRAGRN